MTMKSRLPLALLPLVFLALGCPNPNAPVMLTGKVTYNNGPLTGGSIMLQAKDSSAGGAGFSGVIDKDGNYTVAEVKPGDYVVTIQSLPDPNAPKPGGSGPGGAAGSPAPAGSTPPGGGAAAAPAGTYMKIDPKYADPKNSGLTVTVKGGGPAKQDFPLTGP